MPRGLPGLGAVLLFFPTVLKGQTTIPQAPPPAPPVVSRDVFAAGEMQHDPPPGASLWTIGEPTDEEQLYLEYINRARLDPAGEAVRLANTTDPQVLSAYSFFQVDLDKMQADVASLPPVPPLAMNAQLLQAARAHTLDMATQGYQGHIGSDGSDPGDRITQAGYPWSTYGENVYAYARSVFHGHAGFEVDWGTGPGGMQDPPGHRLNIHGANFREVGIGVVNTNHPDVGPQVVTQDFATRSGATPLITGVAYFDLNTNGFYDLGEGIGGIEVVVSGNNWYGRTAVSGGYAVPVPGNGSYTVTFSAPGLTHVTNVSVINLGNVKLDLTPAYMAPYPAGPDPAALTNQNLYTWSPVAAATNYQWESSRLLNDPFFEGGEGDLSQVTFTVSEGYDPHVTGRVASGNFAFHLAHPSPATAQVLQLNPVFWIRANSQVRFASRLGWATPNQIARLQISTDEGRTWNELWSRAGTGDGGQSAYSTVTVPLSAYAGRAAQLRFVYDFTGGQYFYQTSTDVGWLVDDIRVENAGRILDGTVTDTGSQARFVFVPGTTGTYLLRVRAQLPGRTLPWGPAREVQVRALALPTLRFAWPVTWSGGVFTATFEVGAPQAGMTFRLWRAPQPAGPWSEETAARFESLSGNTLWKVTAPASAMQGWYRLSVN